MGASELNYPRVSLSGDTVTGLAIVNPGTESATITLKAFGGDGNLLKTPHNPVVLSLGPGEQLARTALELFGAPDKNAGPAWVRGESATDGLTGFFLYLDNQITFFDGAEIPEPTEQLLFPEVRIEPGAATELNLVNPNEATAHVEFILYGGVSPVTRTLTLPAFGSTRTDAATLFGVSPGTGGSSPGSTAYYVTVGSDQPLVGCAFVQFQHENVGLSARPLDEALDRLLFPQFAVLDPFVSELTLVNLSNQSVIATVTAHQPDGSLYQVDGGSNPVPIGLKPKEAVRRDLETLFGFKGSATLVGWLEVEASTPSLNGVLTYTVPSLGSRASVAAVSQGSQFSIFSHIATVLGYYTGLAVLNPGALTANLQLAAMDYSGKPVGTHSEALAPGARISKLITELIPESQSMGGGFIWLRSDLPVYSTSLFGRLENGILSNIPPQPSPDNFQPSGVEEPWGITPPLAVVQPQGNMTFQLQGTPGAPVQWSVNSVAGGSPQTGTISAAGVFKGPSKTPAQLPVFVAASADDASAGASVDILSPQELFSSLGEVQSVAYLTSAQRLYAAELQATQTFGDGAVDLQATDATRIVDATTGTPVEVGKFTGETIPQMVPFQAIDNREYLLLVGEKSGSIIRFDPATGRRATVLSGLDQPSAMVLDSAENAVLVAEATEVNSYDLSLLNAGLSAKGASSPDQQTFSPKRRLFAASHGHLAIDSCTGNIYATIAAEGRLLEYVRATGAIRTIAEGLVQPGAVLGLYRAGGGCPAAFHLLVAQAAGENLLNVIPAEKRITGWFRLRRRADLIFLPPGNSFTRSAAILISDLGAESSAITLVELPGLYMARLLNPLRRPPASPCTIKQLTDTTGSGIESAVITPEGSSVFFGSSENLTGKNPDGNVELFEWNLDQPSPTQLTYSTQGTNSNPRTSFDGSVLAWNSTARLFDGQPVGFFVYLLGPDNGQLRVLQGNPAQGASISEDGRRLVYFSNTNATQGNPDRSFEVFLYDTATGTLTQETSAITESSYAPILSGDGNTLAFISNADIRGLNPELRPSVFLKDLSTGQTTLVAPIANEVSLFRAAPFLNRDGSRLFFTSRLDLTGKNLQLRSAVYYFDRLKGSLEQVTPPAADSSIGSVNASGSFLAITSRGDPARLNRDGNEEIFLLALNSRFFFQVTRSQGASHSSPSLPAEAKRLVFVSNADYVDRNSDHNPEIFVGECEP